MNGNEISILYKKFILSTLLYTKSSKSSSSRGVKSKPLCIGLMCVRELATLSLRLRGDFCTDRESSFNYKFQLLGMPNKHHQKYMYACTIKLK